MEQTYVIIWTTKTREGSGIGHKNFTKERAEALAAELNADHPQFVHQAVDASVIKPLEALAELRRSLSYPEVSLTAVSAEEKTVVVDFQVEPEKETALAGAVS